MNQEKAGYALESEEAFASLETARRGLAITEAEKSLQTFGANELWKKTRQKTVNQEGLIHE